MLNFHYKRRLFELCLILSKKNLCVVKKLFIFYLSQFAAQVALNTINFKNLVVQTKISLLEPVKHFSDAIELHNSINKPSNILASLHLIDQVKCFNKSRYIFTEQEKPLLLKENKTTCLLHIERIKIVVVKIVDYLSRAAGVISVVGNRLTICKQSSLQVQVANNGITQSTERRAPGDNIASVHCLWCSAE